MISGATVGPYSAKVQLPASTPNLAVTPPWPCAPSDPRRVGGHHRRFFKNLHPQALRGARQPEPKFQRVQVADYRSNAAAQ